MGERFRDDMGRDVVLGRAPQRIVSLVPSETFNVFALGAGQRLVGRTRYCDLPAEACALPEVGGTKDVDPDRVAALAPDLILANQEENARAPLEALAARRLPVFVSFPRRLADGAGHLARLARMLGIARDPVARAVIREAYAAVPATPPPIVATAFVPIWNEPLMTFNHDTFASDVLASAGIGNVFADRERRYPLAADLARRSPIPAEGPGSSPTGDRLGDRDTRYPRIRLEEVLERAPDMVLLPDEPYAFGPSDRDDFASLDIPAAKTGAIYLVSGKDLFWPGARSISALSNLAALAARARSASFSG
ncbi:MAG TPA: helical backbone metal receptor [Kofleriaceae bacterium]|nr:helical backbone metal receptor [Kofleriaceae bacterium]